MQAPHLVLGVVPLQEPDSGLGQVERLRLGQVLQPLDVGLDALTQVLKWFRGEKGNDINDLLKRKNGCLSRTSLHTRACLDTTDTYVMPSRL